MGGAIPPLTPTSSWHGTYSSAQGQLYLTLPCLLFQLFHELHLSAQNRTD
jgi:hypothetical protein